MAMTLDDVLMKLRQMRGQFKLNGKGMIRHKTRKTQSGAFCCPMAALCENKPDNNGIFSLGRQLGLCDQDAIQIASAADRPKAEGFVALTRERMLKALGLRKRK
jgi:hypothetical protein